MFSHSWQFSLWELLILPAVFAIGVGTVWGVSDAVVFGLVGSDRFYGWMAALIQSALFGMLSAKSQVNVLLIVAGLPSAVGLAALVFCVASIPQRHASLVGLCLVMLYPFAPFFEPGFSEIVPYLVRGPLFWSVILTLLPLGTWLGGRWMATRYEMNATLWPRGRPQLAFALVAVLILGVSAYGYFCRFGAITGNSSDTPASAAGLRTTLKNDPATSNDVELASGEFQAPLIDTLESRTLEIELRNLDESALREGRVRALSALLSSPTIIDDRIDSNARDFNYLLKSDDVRENVAPPPERRIAE